MFWKGGYFPLQLANLQIERLQAGDLLHVRGHLIIYSSTSMVQGLLLGDGKLVCSVTWRKKLNAARKNPARNPADLRHLAMAYVAIAITLLALELKVLRLRSAESTPTALTARPGAGVAQLFRVRHSNVVSRVRL